MEVVDEINEVSLTDRCGSCVWNMPHRPTCELFFWVDVMTLGRSPSFPWLRGSAEYTAQCAVAAGCAIEMGIVLQNIVHPT